jgi:hypothetical protein
MHPQEKLIERFYTAFQNKNYREMQDLYHPDATFYDPVFQDLSAREVKGMWQMLVTSARDLEISHGKVSVNENRGRCEWQAWYTFTATGKKVHNIIRADFEFRDEMIFRHKDHFDFWRWSRMALGIPGLLLGWSPVIRNKVRTSAKSRLYKFLQDHNPSAGK